MKNGWNKFCGGGYSRPASVFFAVIFMLGLLAPCFGETKTWTGAESTDWHTDGNWDPSGVPADGDDVIISDGNVLLTNSTALLGSFDITNRTLTFTNWATALQATNATIRNGAILKHIGPYNTTAGLSNRVYIVCSDLELQAGGSINVDTYGYYGTSSAETSPTICGGSHGGRGGPGLSHPSIYLYPYTTWITLSSSVSGSSTMPERPGQGGRGVGYNIATGGGVVRINAAGTVTIAGTITANGKVGYQPYTAVSDLPRKITGGGAGGSIFITCDEFDFPAGGIIRADGGDAPQGSATTLGFSSVSFVNCGAGGGGRIAISNQTFGTFEGSLSVAPGARWPICTLWNATTGPNESHRVFTPPVYYFNLADWGTIYVPGITNLLATVPTNINGYLVTPGFTSWSPSSLTVSNCFLGFADDGFQLNVEGAISVGTGGGIGVRDNGTITCGGGLALDGTGILVRMGTNSALTVTGDVVISKGELVVNSNSQVTVEGNIVVSSTNAWLVSSAVRCTGSLTNDDGRVVIVGDYLGDGDIFLTNSSVLCLFSGPTNATATNYGALVSVTGNVVIASNSWIYPYCADNGGAHLFVVSNLTIAEGGGINANARGFGRGAGPGAAANQTTDSRGPGGAGYGGVGGHGSYASAVGGTNYGNANAPVRPGSRGAMCANQYIDAYQYAGFGGGLIRIRAVGAVSVDGAIYSSGQIGSGSSTRLGAGGAGGGIFIDAATFQGGATGVLNANGGNGTSLSSSLYSGAGAGGRIAVWFEIGDEARRQKILGGNTEYVFTATNYTGFAGAVTADGGICVTNSIGDGEPGTIVFLTVKVPGTVFYMR